jgi:hypothetical protein
VRSNLIGRLTGLLLLLASAAGIALGGFWAFMKASGAEVDYCDGSQCISGWYPAGTILLVAALAGLLGLALLRARL